MGIGIVLDVVILSIVLSSMFWGYKEGLVKVIFNIFAFLVALIATLILYKPVSNLVIERTEFDDRIKAAIIEEYESQNSNGGLNGIPEIIEDTISSITDKTREEAVEEVAAEIAIKAIQIIVGICLFIIIRFILIFLRFLTESLAELPIIKQFNEVGGALYGLLRAGLIVYILVTILYFVVSINNSGKIQEAVDNSYITKFLYEHNLIINSIDK